MNGCAKVDYALLFIDNAHKSQAFQFSNHTINHVCPKETCQAHSYNPTTYIINEYYLSLNVMRKLA